MRPIRPIPFVLLALVLSAACDGEPTSVHLQTDRDGWLKVTPEEPAALAVGDTMTFSAYCTWHSHPRFDWRIASEDSGVLSVDIDGRVTAHSPGSAWVVAELGNHYPDSTLVTVE